MLDNRVARNLPDIYDGIKETDELTKIAAIELDDLDVARKRVEVEQFIMTASEKFIRMRERGYDIRADPTTESLEFRRRRLIVRQSTRLPITQRKVHEILTELVGDSNFEEYLEVENCSTTFVFEATDATLNQEIDFTLEQIIPLNMDLKIARRLMTQLYLPSYLSTGSEITLYPMNIDNLESYILNTSLVGLQTASTITFTPF
ncbi:putative phage tail protein [Lysinibacillus fusiformis]|uniref:putative phage tail protein n=1 Tax=Lysinibacillus fusiformis TaxID=28031 RepID=UPI002D768F7E|nr:putative phage tail protein [Lysinibacillus fusiformis]WRS99880.1 putative phage tail protein [Lysinibacillus fusiformis]